MSNWLDVCGLDDISPDTGICALVNGEQVAIFRPSSADCLYAVGNYDPIGKANVLSRGLISDVQGKLTVASPLYKQHYCLDSGTCLEESDVSIPTYTVKVENDRVLIAS
ncbi:MAG: nitrite reductase small subunit NirD [Pseudomonadales bacterium]|uniref:NAD(P)H-dependent nitrite reductase, small subunit n=1 Tax=Oleiphilus messinensis TaxID=141451 RepID=A0A1Y0I6V3_9GAMM|nr:nitrite reductase small subunit NirD [Oleiphilus messinensis]ARU56227.1 NAD(P)H-dependent nitrite reductase, small subunit [Oleiphilus messinensis]MCG8611489.1 nitrite reductase small subunit NirD [Pseudomonadales bacterium]